MRYKLLVITILACFVSVVSSQNSKKRGELERMKKVAQEMISETNKMLTETTKSALTSLNNLNILNEEIRTRRSLIAALNEEVSLIEKEQKEIAREVMTLESDLNKKKEKYGQAMRSIYSKRSGIDEIMFVFSAETLTQSYRRARYLKEYSDWRKAEAHEISMRQKNLNEKKNILEPKKKEQQSVLIQRKNEAEQLREKEKNQKTIVAGLEKKKKTLQAELNKRQKEAKDLDRQIQKIIEAEAKKVAQQNKKVQAAGASATKEQLKENNEIIRLSGTFEKNKGKLPVPVNGSYVIVSRFGRQQHPQLKQVVLNNSGVEYKTKPGAEARSVFDGVVSHVLIMKGDNCAVMIKHGNYMTVYSNIKDVYVKNGDNVTAGQTIGRIFSDDSNGGETLMQFQLWKETTKLNPELWIAK